MRDINRIDRIIELLRELWKKYPDQRLGQLLENYIFFAGERGDVTSVRLFYQEDDITERILKDKIEWVKYHSTSSDSK